MLWSMGLDTGQVLSKDLGYEPYLDSTVSPGWELWHSPPAPCVLPLGRLSSGPLCIYIPSTSQRQHGFPCEVRLAGSPLVLSSRIGNLITMEEERFPIMVEIPNSLTVHLFSAHCLGDMAWCHY